MRLKFVVALAFTLLAVVAAPAGAAYRLGVGDVIEFSATSVPDLRQRSRVDAQGEITLPLIGQVRAAGRPLSEVRAEVAKLMPTKTLRRRTLDGGPTITVIDPEDVVLEIVEYRPVYVLGDVETPGAQTFQPGLVVRQAIALAGGYRRPDAGQTLQTSDLRSDYERLWAEYADTQVRLWRAEAELNGTPALPAPDRTLREAPLPRAMLDRIVAFEQRKLADSATQHERSRASLRRQLEVAEAQAQLVQEQLEQARQGVKLALADLARVQTLHEKGLTPITRVNDERRLTLQAQTLALQVTERLEQVQRDREELARRIEKAADDRQAELNKEVQEAYLKLADLRSRLQAAADKLSHANAIIAQVETVRTDERREDRVILIRDGAEMEADLNFTLAPGDTIDIRRATQRTLLQN